MMTEIATLRKEVKLLKTIVYIMACMFIITVTIAFSTRTRFSEIDAERINIVEKNGDLKMVISNKEKQHPGRMNGKELQARQREAGIIFFNGAGDECGGLVYDSDKKSAGMIYSVDKYLDDQVMQLQYIENLENKKRKYGLQFWTYGKENAFEERYRRYKSLENLADDSAKNKGLAQMKKEGLLSADRLFIGKNYQDEIGMFINDSDGKPRIRLYVNKNNTAKIEMLDERGNVINQ